MLLDSCGALRIVQLREHPMRLHGGALDSHDSQIRSWLSYLRPHAATSFMLALCILLITLSTKSVTRSIDQFLQIV